MRKTQFAAALAACMLAFAGCGDDTTDNGAAGGDTAGNGTQGNMMAGEDASGPTPGGPMEGGVDAGSAAAGGTDAGMSTGTTPDAGMMSSVDDPKTPGNDAAGKVACGASTPECPSGQKCCAGQIPGTLSCKATCGGGEALAACDGPEDCPGGQVCCSGLGKPAACTANCNDTVGCHTDKDCPPGKNVCKPGNLFPWGFCG